MCEVRDLLVLVVDDNIIRRDNICALLYSLEVSRIICTSSEEEAIATLTCSNLQTVDIILTSLNLKCESIKVSLKKIQSLNVPLFAYCHGGSELSHLSAVLSGAYDFFNIGSADFKTKFLHKMRKWVHAICSKEK
jgi:CheY-like chemotaxis protein